MPTINENFANFLRHFDESYDPAARREYYLRTRELKGRTSSGPIKAPTGNTGVVKPTTSKPVKKSNDAEKRREAQKAQVEALKKKLATLKEVLQKLVDKAQGKSTSSSDSKKASEKKSTDKAPIKKLTPKQEADARKRAAEAYAKNKTKPLADVTKELKTQIADVQEKIKAMKRHMSKTPVKKTVPVGAGKKKT